MGNAREHKRTREAIGIRWIWRRTAEMVSIKSTQERRESLEGDDARSSDLERNGFDSSTEASWGSRV